MSQAHHVAIVLSGTFGDRLEALAKVMHVWIVGTPQNRQAAQRLWTESPEYSHEHGVTTMAASGRESADDLFSSMLDAVDVHHGEWSHDPPWTSVHVFGIGVSEKVLEALAVYGASDIQHHADHFIATRDAPLRRRDD